MMIGVRRKAGKGVGKAVHFLFHKWPTPRQSGEFEKLMRRHLKKAKNRDQAFVLAFNEYLAQKRLSAEELSEVLAQGQGRRRLSVKKRVRREKTCEKTCQTFIILY